MDKEVDIVVTWVDMNDPKWRESFLKHSNSSKGYSANSVSETRFRDYGLLKYWFRGIEKFMPWVRKIHFIASSNVPDWLDLDNPKVHIVRHKDIIPTQFLPTFNSVVIERYIHKIDGLADRFIYFNDDFYVINHIGIERFFQKGLPCDIAVFQYNPSWAQWYVRIKNNIRLINEFFDKREVLRMYHDKWFSKKYGHRLIWNYFYNFYGKFITLRVPHNAQPYLKSTFQDVWDAVGNELNKTSVNKFRTSDDYTPELFRTWQICQGNFEPYNTYSDTKMFPLMIKADRAVQAIRQQSYNLICLNDHVKIRNYKKVMETLTESFESILPEPSSFEKNNNAT